MHMPLLLCIRHNIIIIVCCESYIKFTYSHTRCSRLQAIPNSVDHRLNGKERHNHIKPFISLMYEYIALIQSSAQQSRRGSLFKLNVNAQLARQLAFSCSIPPNRWIACSPTHRVQHDVVYPPMAVLRGAASLPLISSHWPIDLRNYRKILIFLQNLWEWNHIRENFRRPPDPRTRHLCRHSARSGPVQYRLSITQASHCIAPNDSLAYYATHCNRHAAHRGSNMWSQLSAATSLET